MRREIKSIDFGEWMRDKRKAQKISQRKLSEYCFCHENSIGRWERGDDSPTLEQVEQIVKVLGAELVIREQGIEEEGQYVQVYHQQALRDGRYPCGLGEEDRRSHQSK